MIFENLSRLKMKKKYIYIYDNIDFSWLTNLFLEII